MALYKIEGGVPLSGTVHATSGKNSPIALICAALLMRGTVRFMQVEQVEEVLRILEVLKSIGVGVTWVDGTTLELDTNSELDLNAIDRAASEQTRIALLLFGALAARASGYRLYRSGGCHLGERSTRQHLYGLNKLGMSIQAKGDYYQVETRSLVGCDIVMLEAGDTATENIVMAAVLAEGTTTIRFASANYMVQDLCRFLQTCGASIEGVGTATLTIHGVATLTPPSQYTPMPDPVDAFAFFSLAIATRSALTITNVPIDFLGIECEYLHTMGQTIEIDVVETHPLTRIATVHLPVCDLRAIPDKLHPRPYPGLNIDSVPLFLPILARASGRTLVHDWIYENRAIYGLELQKLGAKVTLMDPHRLIIEGPSELTGADLSCPPALRPGMALLIAMLAATGPSVLRNVYMIERGYGNVAARLQGVGAHITRLDQ